MATNFTLTFWLKSLELEQYIGTFQEHHITTHQQCLDLDENKLSDIGVNAVGHRRRILNHSVADTILRECLIIWNKENGTPSGSHC